MSRGRQTWGKTMNHPELSQAAIDREALRISNATRPYHQRIRFIDTMNPQAQEYFRLLAVQSLTGKP